MSTYDYVIVGAGSAGCVLGARLSEHSGTSVAVVEGGGPDKNPMIKIPKGFGKLLGNPDYAWYYPTVPGPTGRVEAWVRGKTLGGSSAINGLVYNRGAKADWDELEKRGNKGWNWDTILPAYKKIENNTFGASPTRGVGGPITITSPNSEELLNGAALEAGRALGLDVVQDYNESDVPRIGRTMANISKGRRVSAAHAFLHPASKRPNLTVITGAVATSVIFEGDRAVGVRVRQGGTTTEIRAKKEVILSLGSLATPKLLQLSGIGPSEVLKAAGVDVRVANDNVGAHMHEHLCFTVQARLNQNVGYNKKLASKLAQNIEGVKYLATHKGILAGASYDIIGFVKTRPELDRIDGQILFSPFSMASLKPGQNPELDPQPGMQVIGFVSRPTSDGRVAITSSDPDAPSEVVPNYYTSDYDRQTGLGLIRKMRELFAQAPLAKYIDHEITPGASVVSDDDLIEMTLNVGYCGYHAISTCAMGPDESDVVDSQLRVRGVSGLRVMDCSVLPTMVAGNLNGPMMAMAHVAADVIRD
ncbi:MAG: GMC family oxidoreductase [Acidimicrobiia bacterium]